MKVLLSALLLLSATSAFAQKVERFEKKDATVALIRADGEATFQINSARGQNACELEGRAVFIDAARAGYTSDDAADQCVAVLNFKGRQLVVTTKGCESRCGLNAAGTMDGTYAAR